MNRRPEEKYGFPLVTVANILPALEALGLKPWPRAINRPPVLLDEYLAGELTAQEAEEVARFAPKAEVVFLEQPDGAVFNGFRSNIGDGVMTFVFLDDEELVVLVAEFVHGSENIRIIPPAGAYIIGDDGPAIDRAIAEVQEETGIVLTPNEIIPLGPPSYIEPRTLAAKEVYFLATPALPLKTLERNPNPTEFIQPLLMQWIDWLALIDKGMVDATAVTATFLAGRELGML